ncbi:MAG: hypothetical protein ACR2H1_12320 [Limisphaerales bacterium]
MAIVLILLVMAAAVLLTVGAVFVGSLLFGGFLLCTKRARVLVPIFFLIVPATVLGSLAGSVIVGYFAIRSNENLIFLGPLGGLVVGGIIGFLLGLVGVAFWWGRIAGTSKQGGNGKETRVEAGSR